MRKPSRLDPRKTHLCRKCKTWKRPRAFGIHYKNRYHTQCIRCRVAYNRRWAIAHPTLHKARTRRRNWLRRYGLTPETYKIMYTAQHGRCAICNDRKRQLDVDHSHKRGTVRGLLCSTCNTGIGLLRDSSDITDLATAYLRRFGD